MTTQQVEYCSRLRNDLANILLTMMVEGMTKKLAWLERLMYVEDDAGCSWYEIELAGFPNECDQLIWFVAESLSKLGYDLEELEFTSMEDTV